MKVVFPLLLSPFTLCLLLFTHTSKSNDIGVTNQSAPNEETFHLKKQHLSSSFNKETKLFQDHHISGSGEDNFKEKGLSSSPDEGSSSFEMLEHSGYTEEKEDSTAEGNINGGGLNGESTDEKLKGFVEAEDVGTTQTTERFAVKTDSPSERTSYAEVDGSGLPIVQTFTPSKVMIEPTEEKHPTMTVQKPTSFLKMLQEIKRELDKLLQWKEAHERKLYEVARSIGEAFKLEQVFKGSQADKKRSHKRMKRSHDDEKESGLSKEILRKIEKNFPCRHPQMMMLMKSGSRFFNQQDCLQCECHLGKITCKKDLDKCYPKACHLLDREIVPNLAIHNDGCNNCLCHFGKLICTHLRCPKAHHHYTNDKANGLKNIEPEDHMIDEQQWRNSHACLECDHLPGPYVCGKKQWKTFPSLCHAIFCGENQDEDIQERACEFLDPCASSPCGKGEKCIPYYQTPCLTGGKTRLLCQQYQCISPNLKCSNSSTTANICGVDGKSYSNQCEMFSKGIQLAYKGACKKKCNSEVCGIESRTFASHCHAKEIHAYVDYLGHCEYHFTTPLIQESSMGDSSLKIKKCDLVYEHQRCAPTKCENAILLPGACCPICGAALVISLNMDRLDKDTEPLRLDHVHTFVTNVQDEISPGLCKVSVDLIYSMDILIVIKQYKINDLDLCRNMAEEIVDKINFERDEEDAGILTVLGSATMVEMKPTIGLM